MIRTTPILCVILIAISLTLSGCVDPNAPEGNTSAPTPTPTHIDADSGAAMPTPTLASMSTPTPTSNATDNATEDKSDWDVCDSRHNASWLYMHGCIGNGSSVWWHSTGECEHASSTTRKQRYRASFHGDSIPFSPSNGAADAK